LNMETSSSEVRQSSTESIPVMPAEQFIAWIGPEINKAARDNLKRKKKRGETLLFIAGYILFILIAGSVYLDYRINGMHGNAPVYLYVLGIMSLGLILYIPLILKLQKMND
jgi:tryptophan-rich sensory protein